MSVIKPKDIANLFADGPLSGTELFKGLVTLTIGQGDVPRIVTSPPVGHFGNDSFDDAIAQTKAVGLKARLSDTYPTGIDLVQIYYGDNPSEYIGLLNENGKYKLWKPSAP